MSSTKQAKISDLNREESQRLRAIWDSTGHGGLSQDAFGQKYEIGSQAAVGFFLGGKSALSLKAAKGFAHGLNCKISDFSDRLAAEANELSQVSDHSFAAITAPMGFITSSGVENQLLASTSALPVAIDLDNNPDYPAVRRVNVKAQAGVSGYAVEYMNDDGPPIVFRADWYKSKSYRPERMLAVRVSGESMIPSLYQDDLIVVNTEQTQPKQGVPFLVSFEGEVVVKRLVRDDGLWWLVSDNSDQRRYPRTKCNGGTEIIGEVVYRQTERI